MLQKLFENEFYLGLYQTIVLFIVITVLSGAVYFILVHGLKLVTEKEKLRTRFTYVASMLFLFFLAKIWVQGFTQIFYGLSLVSAGLVITNKETIMNLVGWGIISWRGLFSEGDYIEIGGYHGVVYELGVLYVKLLESSPTHPARSTGKFIKVPNGTIIHQSVKRVSLNRHFIEQHIHCLIPFTSEIKALKNNLLEIVQNVLKTYHEKNAFPQKIKKEAALIKTMVYQKPKVDINFDMEKLDNLKVTISYHCKAALAETIDFDIKKNIARMLKSLNSNNLDKE